MTALAEQNQGQAVQPSLSDYRQICEFLYRESRLLDDRDLDTWLACYDDQVEYWVPAWTDDDELTTDPQREISLIYYANRRGLEDRVYRLKTERSSASTPEARTSHFLANIEVLAQREGEVDVRYNWHTLSHRYQQTQQFFGTAFVTLKESDAGFVITNKKIVLKDDYIHQVVDIYHL